VGRETDDDRVDAGIQDIDLQQVGDLVEAAGRQRSRFGGLRLALAGAVIDADDDQCAGLKCRRITSDLFTPAC
jgi:hypothetical protein